jgi:hypothetical protein
MEKEFFDLLGLGTPFYLAAATYAVFAWLDRNASDEATNVISSWLHGRSQNKLDLGNLIINTFDRIYISPLLSFRAFCRSAAISATFWLLFNLVPFFHVLIRYWRNFPTPSPSTQVLGPFYTWVVFLILFFYVVLTELLNLVLTVLSDYLSLPFVRRFLRLARTYPITSSVISSIIGVAVITISYLLWIIGPVGLLIIPFVEGDIGDIMTEISDFYHYMAPAFKQFFQLSLFVGSMRPAFIIHLWLPLFALSSVAVRLVFWIFRAVEKAQWFLKQGDAHPLKAIGIVATLIVFGSAMLVKEGWALLGVLERS